MTKELIERRYGNYGCPYVFADIKVPYNCSLNHLNTLMQPALVKIKDEALEEHNWTIKQKDVVLFFEGHSEGGQYLNYCVYCILWEHEDWEF